MLHDDLWRGMSDKIKLFHDDNRFPPDDSWEWVKTNDEAKEILALHNVGFISIDMDLGAIEGTDFRYGKERGDRYRGLTCKNVDWLRNMNNDPGENGLDLAKWMIEQKIIPERIVVHTWNYWGANAIIEAFKAAGHDHVQREFWTHSSDFYKRVYS